MSTDSSRATARLYRCIHGNWSTMVVCVYAELGVADILAGSSRTEEEIARLTGTDPAAMTRVLRCAEELGLHQRDPGEGKLHLTETGRLLASDTPGSLRAAARLNGAPYRYGPWGGLLEYVRGGSGRGLSPAWEMGTPAWLAQQPEQLAVFEAAMSDLGGNARGGRDENAAIAGEVDFTLFRSVLDIGGGDGSLLAAITKRHPRIEAAVFDLPEVFQALPPPADSIRRIAGDFLEGVPSGFDAYLMKNIIHNHPPARCRRLFDSVRTALEFSAPSSRLLLFEMVLDAPRARSTARAFTNLNLNLLVGGEIRTLEGFRELLADAGLELFSSTPLPGGERSILEVGARAVALKPKSTASPPPEKSS